MSTSPSSSSAVLDANAFTPMLAPQVQQDLAARAPDPIQDQQQVTALVAQIDLRDSNSIIFLAARLRSS